MTTGPMTTAMMAPSATDRTLLRSVDRWALVSGVTGCVANGLLLALFAVAQRGNPAYDWTGPANDVVGAVSTVAMIPVVLGLTRHLEGPPQLTLLARLAVATGVVQVTGAALLVTGIISFEVSLWPAMLYIAALFGWHYAVGRTARRSRRLTRRLALASEALGLSAILALPVAGLAAVLPPGSTLQYATWGLALLPGVAAILGEPIWLLALSRRLSADAASAPG